MHDDKMKEFCLRKSDTGNTIERILADAWLDADRGDWPKYNHGQRKRLIEEAFKDLWEIKN